MQGEKISAIISMEFIFRKRLDRISGILMDQQDHEFKSGNPVNPVFNPVNPVKSFKGIP
jgi:hypothetical protein